MSFSEASDSSPVEPVAAFSPLQQDMGSQRLREQHEKSADGERFFLSMPYQPDGEKVRHAEVWRALMSE